jgi:hypothetical protein
VPTHKYPSRVWSNDRTECRGTPSSTCQDSRRNSLWRLLESSPRARGIKAPPTAKKKKTTRSPLSIGFCINRRENLCSSIVVVSQPLIFMRWPSLAQCLQTPEANLISSTKYIRYGFRLHLEFHIGQLVGSFPSTRGGVNVNEPQPASQVVLHDPQNLGRTQPRGDHFC